MASVKALEDKMRKLNSLLDPDKASDSLTGSECSELGMLSMKVGAVYNDFRKTDQKNKHINSALKSLEKIEKDANKILNKGGGKFKYFAVIIAIIILYLVFMQTA